MFDKILSEVNISDIQQLIDNAVSESITIEYKSQLPKDNSADRKEFLADVSSFTNASGGDLVFGITEEKGIPIDIYPSPMKMRIQLAVFRNL